MRSLLTAIAVQAVAIVLQTWLIGFNLSLFATAATVWAIWLGMSVTAAGTMVLAHQVLGHCRISRTQAGAMIILGAAFGFILPLSRTAGVQLPDLILGWATGPALPTWQGILTMMIGAFSLLQGPTGPDAA